MFPSTQPFDAADHAADLMRASDFRRYLAGRSRLPGPPPAGHPRMAQLNPSLMQDLQRFEPDRVDGMELLEVMAAAVRHGRPLLLHLHHGVRVLPLTVFPAERLVHCPLPMAALLSGPLAGLRVLQVEPAQLRPPGTADAPGLAAPPDRVAPLGPVLWALALRGSREALLPEIAGSAAYRIAPGADLSPLALGGGLAAGRTGAAAPADVGAEAGEALALAEAIQRLRRHTTNLREISGWPGLDAGRATRLLNGLYLQAALMVTRSHPAATNEGWVRPPT